MGCIKAECEVYDGTIPGCWEGLEPDKCGGPHITIGMILKTILRRWIKHLKRWDYNDKLTRRITAPTGSKELLPLALNVVL